MSWQLTAVLELKDRMSKPMKQVARQVETLNRMSEQTSSNMAVFASRMPAIAPLGAAAGGLASSMASAGLAAASYGAVASSALIDVFEAADEVTEINEKLAAADTAKEQIAAQKELAAVYADMSQS
ncbi:hypothetical protein RG959_01710 [Domibacillus sp. 8LH]|uniref:hypothetical protein n=1 Tax=Domibacillus sp. 8LH TaxID=3073900 RepID=UPI0031720848